MDNQNSDLPPLNKLKEKLITIGLDEKSSDNIVNEINLYNEDTDNSDSLWQHIKKELPFNELFDCHLFLYNYIQEFFNVKFPPANWVPSAQNIENTNLYKFMQYCHHSKYDDFFEWSSIKYEHFWSEIIEFLDIQFIDHFSEVCHIENIEKPEWLYEAKLNIVDSCFNIKDKSKTAIIYKNELQKEIKKVSYRELEKLTNQIAWSIDNLNLDNGTKIAINMPMSLESIAIYLAIIKTGNCVVSIADSFAPKEIATRIKISEAKLFFTQDIIVRAGKNIDLYTKVVDAKSPKAIVFPILDFAELELRDEDISFEDFLVNKDSNYKSKSCNPHDHINILFSSGTTGTPKAIPWDHTTPIKVASDAHLHIDINKRDTVAWPTSLGWMMGPWLIFASLINKATISLYYGQPHSKDFVEFIQDSKTTILGLVPSLAKAWKSKNLLKDINWSNIKLFATSGEASSIDDMFWLSHVADYKPIIEYCGGTEIGGAYITSTLISPNVPSYFTTPALGLDIKLLGEHNKFSNKGEVAIVPPSIGLSRELLNKNHHNVYYKGMPKLIDKRPLRRHGDAIEKLDNGFYKTLGRVDDTMNLGGIKISSVEIEKVLNSIEGIKECAAVGVQPKSGGTSELIIFAVENNDSNNIDNIKETMQQSIKENLNPLFKIKEVKIIEELPRTSSNKIMRRVLRDNYEE